MAGQKTKLTNEVSEGILKRVRAGTPLKHAAQAMGIAENTAREWIARGEGTDPDRPSAPVYATFAKAIKEAQAEAIVERVALIQKAALAGTWTAAAWWLERRANEEFGRVDKLQTENKTQLDVSGEVTVIDQRSDEERIAGLFGELAKLGLGEAAGTAEDD